MWQRGPGGHDDVLHSEIAEVGNGEGEQFGLVKSDLFNGRKEIPAEFMATQRAFGVDGVVMINRRLVMDETASGIQFSTDHGLFKVKTERNGKQ